MIKVPGAKDYKLIKLRNPYGTHSGLDKTYPPYVLEKLGE